MQVNVIFMHAFLRRDWVIYDAQYCAFKKYYTLRVKSFRIKIRTTQKVWIIYKGFFYCLRHVSMFHFNIPMRLWIVKFFVDNAKTCQTHIVKICCLCIFSSYSSENKHQCCAFVHFLGSFSEPQKIQKLNLVFVTPIILKIMYYPLCNATVIQGSLVTNDTRRGRPPRNWKVCG